MIERRPIFLFASTAALALALHQGAWADEIAVDTTEATAPAAEAPVSEASTTEAQTAEAPTAEAPAAEAPDANVPVATPPMASPAPPPSITAARERMEQRQAEMMEGRKLRYDELRSRAAEAGIQLPETPPWEHSGMQPPPMPTPPEMPMPADMPPPPEMPSPYGSTASPGAEAPVANRGRMTTEERDAMREQRYQAKRKRAQERGVDMPETPPWKLMSQEERQAHREAMRDMTPEERQAAREAHWQEMRERAQDQGVEFPETPVWKQMEQHRQEMQTKWEQYQSIVEQMSKEQREAAEAVFGQAGRGAPPAPMRPQMPPRMPMQAPYGGNYGMPMRPMQPGYGGQGANQPMYQGGPNNPWYGGNEGMYQGPPPPSGGYGPRW